MTNEQKLSQNKEITIALRKKIIKKEMQPGSRIIEYRLSEEFGVSRARIREALRQLEGEGLIVYQRNIGYTVKHLTIRDVYETYYLRAHYEIMAMRLCRARFSEEEISLLTILVNSMQVLTKETEWDLFRLDEEFHRILVEKSHMPKLIQSWSNLNYGNYLATSLESFHTEQLIEKQHSLHLILLKAIMSGDEKEISSAIFHHYMNPVKEEFIASGIPMESYIFDYE